LGMVEQNPDGGHESDSGQLPNEHVHA